MTESSFELARQEQHYDHLDDTGMFDAATMRQKSGLETDGTNEDFTADAIAARTGNVMLAGYMQDAPSDKSEKGGLDHQAWAAANTDTEQAKINAEGLRNVRDALENPSRED